MASTRLYGPTVATATPAAPTAINVQVGKGIAPLPAQLVPGASSTAEAMVPNPSNLPNPLLVQIPSGSQLDGKPFMLEASGFITTGASGAVTAKVYSGVSATPGSNTLLGSSGAVTQNSVSAPFFASAKLIFDSVSGKLQGTIQFMVNNVLVATAAVSNVITGLNNKNNPVASFGLSFQFSVANAANLVQINDWAINF